MVFTLLSYAQNIKGILLDGKNNKPLVSANVYIKNTHEGFSTSKKGRFALELSNQALVSDTIYFSHVGYLTKKITILEFLKTNHVVCLYKPSDQQ